MADRRTPDDSLTVLVTGAGTGFGRGAAVRLAERGHRVLAGALTEDEAAELTLAHPGIEGLKLDITDEQDRRQVADTELDVLVNNAGLGQAGPLRCIPMELVRRVFEVNVFGTLAMTQTVLPGMLSRGHGRILIMSSVAGVLAGPFTGPYSMTKHSLQAMASALRHELSEAGIDVALINPGPFATGFNDGMVDESLSWFDLDHALPAEPRLLEETRQRITGAQLDPNQVVEVIVDLVEADETELSNFVPPDFLERIGHT